MRKGREQLDLLFLSVPLREFRDSSSPALQETQGVLARLVVQDRPRLKFRLQDPSKRSSRLNGVSRRDENKDASRRPDRDA